MDPPASVIIAGDFNEFTQTRSVFEAFNSLVVEVDELASIPPVERYTYVFDNLQKTARSHVRLASHRSARGRGRAHSR